MLEVKVKKLHDDAKMPSYAHPGDAGMDLYVQVETKVAPGQRLAVPTGISMAIPEGCVGLIWDKSGIAIREGVKTLGGVIDSGYRGEILVGVVNLSDKEYVFGKGHKVAQILIQKVESPKVTIALELDGTARGEGGFGSTGK